MAAGPVGVLQAVADAGQVVEMLQRHYHTAVQPRLAVVRSYNSCCAVYHDVGRLQVVLLTAQRHPLWIPLLSTACVLQLIMAMNLKTSQRAH